MLISVTASLIFIATALSLGLFLTKRLQRYLQYLQQEQYHTGDFLSWYRHKRAIDKRGLLILFSCLCLSFITTNPFVPFCLLPLAFIIIYFLEPSPKTKGKIRLSLTKRAKEIYYLAFLLQNLSFIALLAVLSAHFQSLSFFLSLMIFTQLPPFFLLLALQILSPWENKRQRFFYNEANQKFRKLSPYTIGITGSFGKTTTKHILAELLSQAKGPTFFPPKGINSLMGVVRSLREGLSSLHEFAVIEMAAFRIGSIKKLCQLCPPDIAIITGLGFMHLEKFGSKENLIKAKSELFQNSKENSPIVINGDSKDCRSMVSQLDKNNIFFYGFDNSKNDLTTHIISYSFTPKGMPFKISYQGTIYEGITSLLGKEMLLNISAAFTTCMQLGADPYYIIACISHLSPIKNRLEVEKLQKVTYLHDAYNSNPIGFCQALDVLASFDGQRKIIMTPGMVDIGSIDEQRQENELLALKMAKICDEVLIIGDENREAFRRGLESSHYPKDKTHYFSSREEGFSYFHQSSKQNDVLLIENDLPDVYEKNIKF